MKRILALFLCACCALTVQAREVIPLNEGWRFFFRSENNSDNARHITLPHSWDTDPEACAVSAETTGNYQNDIHIPAEWASQRIFIRFYGVQSVGELFVNGCHAGSHYGGATAFTFEITDKVRFGADNSLLMVVSSGFRSDVLPVSTDMNLYGGIYRRVELILTERTAVSPLYLGTDGVLVRPADVDDQAAAGEVEVHLTSKGESACTLTLDITAPDGTRVFSRRQRLRLDGKPVLVPFRIERPALWSPSSPSLYTVTASLGEADPTDAVSVRTGFRTVAVGSAEGLTINGERIPVHGVVLYHDNAVDGGTLTREDCEADLERIADLGANAVRSAVMPHGPYFYDRCDERGLLAWVDLPLHRAPFLSDVAYYATPQFEQNGLQQLQEIIAQNMNHPSVVMWGLFSGLWNRGDDVTPYLRRLNETAHALDPSRPTAACSDQDGGINFITDLIVWRQDVGWRRGSTDDLKVWRDLLQKNWSHLRSAVSYGGEGFPGQKRYTAMSAPRANWKPEEDQTRFHEEYARNLQDDSLFWGVWIANMFDYGSARRPYGVNGEGLVTLDRRTCKDAYYLYRAMWNGRQPTLHLVDKRRWLRTQPRQAFRVYSSAGAPVLLVGGDTVAMTAYAPCQYRSDSVSLAGEVPVRVYAGALADSMVIRVGNVLEPTRTQAPRRTTGLQKTN